MKVPKIWQRCTKPQGRPELRNVPSRPLLKSFKWSHAPRKSYTFRKCPVGATIELVKILSDFHSLEYSSESLCSELTKSLRRSAYDGIRWSRPTQASFFTWVRSRCMVRNEVPRVLQFLYKMKSRDLLYPQMISPKGFAIGSAIFEIWPLHVGGFEVKILAKSTDMRFTIEFIK